MLERITVRNFKSIGEVTVDLSPVTVFIGRSGVGKSNFLRAIRFLRTYLMNGEQAVMFEGGWDRIWPFGSPQPLALTVTFRIPGFDELFRYAAEWTPQVQASVQGSAVLSAESLMFGSQPVFEWDATGWSAWPAQGEGPRGVNQVYLNRFPTVSEAVLSFTALTNSIGWHDFPANVLTKGPRTPEPFRQPFAGLEEETKGLSDDAGNYLSVIRDLTQDLRDQHARRQILARLRQVNETVRSVELDSIQNPQRAIVGHQVGSARIPLELSQESDGFRRYYAHLLSLYQTPPKQVLMFEEPENGVYPGALRNLAEEFATAPRETRGQILMTTQSPALLDGFEADQIRVVELDPVTQQTRIGPLDPAQAEAVRERLLEPGELLTVDKARIALNAVGVSSK